MLQLPNDNEILKMLAIDPEKGYALLFKKYKNFQFVDKLVKDSTLPESYVDDLKSDMLIALYQNVNKGNLTQLSGKFSTYLYAIARYILLSKIRALPPEDSLPESYQEPELKDIEWVVWTDEPLDLHEQEVKKCLDNMPPECQKLLRAKFANGLNNEKLKELFGFASEEVARQRVYKCLENMRKCVKKIANMDRDDSSLLELLRRFLDNELSASEKMELKDLLQADSRASKLLEEEKALRRALGKISRQEIIALARKTVRAPAEERYFRGIFPRKLYSWRLAAAMLVGLAVGTWLIFAPEKTQEEHQYGNRRQHTILFDKELPVLMSRQNPEPSDEVLTVTLVETNTTNPTYILEGNELRIAVPRGFWQVPLELVYVFKSEKQFGILLQVNDQLYALSPTSIEKDLPAVIETED